MAEGGEQKVQESNQEAQEEPPTLEAQGESSYKTETQQVELGKPSVSPGISGLWGLSEKVEGWQVSGMPQDKLYFALQGDVYEASQSAIKAHLDANDGNFRGSWILTEVDHWDIERERVIVLTDYKLIVVKYDFMNGIVEEIKRIQLSPAFEYVYGDFKYPNTYFYARTGKGIKITWDRNQQLGFWDRWNPFSSKPAETILCSHVLQRKGYVQDTRLSIVNFYPELEKVLQELQAKGQLQGEGATSTSPPPFEMKKADIVLDTKLGLSAMIHNQSHLGYSKKRGLVDW